jgi:hypothetical protein
MNNIYNAHTELMVDYLEELYDIGDIIDILNNSIPSFTKYFIATVKEEYDWYAERQDEHSDRTQKLLKLIDHLETHFA